MNMSLLGYFKTARAGARSRGVLGILIVIAAALLCCPVVYADHCKGKHRNDPGCDGGGNGGGGGEGTWSFHAESSGHVTGMYNSKEYNISNDVQNLVFNKFGGNSYTLGDFFVFHDYDGRSGEECFVSSSIDRAGTMQLYDDLGNDSDLAARLWFTAGNDPADPADKVDDLKYVLDLYDASAGWAGPFPPDKDLPSVRVATHWELRTVRKGDLRKDPCVSGGILGFPSGDVTFQVIQNP